MYMKKAVNDVLLIQKFFQQQRGVFTTSDLRSLFKTTNKIDFYRRIRGLKEAGVLQKFCRGIYTSGEVDLARISQRICPESYASLATVLAKNLLIGTIPKRTFYAVKPGRTKKYKGKEATILQFGVVKHLFFGFETTNGLRYADKEKAFLDTLYFYQKGERFFFNIYEDINFNALDRKKIERYLQHYRNPKFKSFVKGLLP